MYNGAKNIPNPPVFRKRIKIRVSIYIGYSPMTVGSDGIERLSDIC